MLVEAFGHNGSRQPAVIVLDDAGRIAGIATTTDFQRMMDEGANMAELTALDIATRNPVTVYPDQSLDEAVRRMSVNALRQLPVVSRADSGQLLGMLGRSDIFTAYAKQARSEVNANEGLSSMSGIEAYGTRVVGVTVKPDSPLVGKTLRQVSLPDECLIASVIRRGEAVIPRGQTKLLANDWLLIIAAPEQREEIEKALASEQVVDVDEGAATR